MPSPPEPDRWRSALAEVNELLAGLADFHAYPELLTHDDPSVQSLVERTVVGIRDARELLAEVVGVLQAREEAASAAAASTDAGAPVPVPSAEPRRIVSPPAYLEQITMANPTGMRELLLIVDHDAESLADMEQMLTEEDYRVLSVRDGFEAISIYARLWAGIDLVILDFSLPGISGDLVFDELQAINPKVMAVVSSGFTHPDRLKQMLAQGLSGFLPKPYERERLIRQIQQVLARRSGR